MFWRPLFLMTVEKLRPTDSQWKREFFGASFFPYTHHDTFPFPAPAQSGFLSIHSESIKDPSPRESCWLNGSLKTTILCGACRYTSAVHPSWRCSSTELFRASRRLLTLAAHSLEQICVGLAVTNILNGLVWLSIRPKTISVVDPNGVECQRICHGLPEYVISELLWAWESLSDVTCCRSFVVVYDGICILQIGFADVSQPNGDEPMVVDADKLIQGSLYKGILRSGSQSYLANLSLYPGKNELPFLPSNTQAAISQPLGDKGIAIIGGDTIRGFNTADQAWITLIGEKLDATLAKAVDRSPLTVEENS